MMHCTSTTMASTAPVRIASSCCRKLPAAGMPWRIRISFAVQQMPDRLTPLAPGCLRVGDDLRVLRGGHDHLAQGGLMAVDDHVDHVVLEHAEVGLSQHGAGVPKRMSETSVAIRLPPQPSARERCARRAAGCARILVVADVGAVHRLDDLAVNTARHDAQLLPELLALGRRAADGATSRAAGRTGRCRGQPGRWRSPRARGLRWGCHSSAATVRSLATSRMIIAFGLSVGHGFQGEGHIAPVVGVGGRPGGNGTDQVAGLDGVDGRPADPNMSRPWSAGKGPCRTVCSTCPCRRCCREPYRRRG
jgi:hypothetical protein